MGAKVKRRQKECVEGGCGMNASRLLSDTVNGCYEKAFMSVWPPSSALNIVVGHLPTLAGPLPSDLRLNLYFRTALMSFLNLNF